VLNVKNRDEKKNQEPRNGVMVKRRKKLFFFVSSWISTAIVCSDAYDSRFVRKYARYEGTNDIVLVTDEHLRVTGILRTRSNKTKGLHTGIILAE
jgi:hypothetical protein